MRCRSSGGRTVAIAPLTATPSTRNGNACIETATKIVSQLRTAGPSTQPAFLTSFPSTSAVAVNSTVPIASSPSNGRASRCSNDSLQVLVLCGNDTGRGRLHPRVSSSRFFGYDRAESFSVGEICMRRLVLAIGVTIFVGTALAGCSSDASDSTDGTGVSVDTSVVASVESAPSSDSSTDSASDSSTETTAASSEALRVVAAFGPLAELAQRVGGSAVSVMNLTTTGVEPHDLEMNTDQIDAIQDAALVVYLGDGFQAAVDDACEGTQGTITGSPDQGGPDRDWRRGARPRRGGRRCIGRHRARWRRGARARRPRSAFLAGSAAHGQSGRSNPRRVEHDRSAEGRRVCGERGDLRGGDDRSRRRASPLAWPTASSERL